MLDEAFVELETTENLYINGEKSNLKWYRVKLHGIETRKKRAISLNWHTTERAAFKEAAKYI